MRPRIYVAGPYTSDPEANTLKAIGIANELWDAGFAPYVPHLTHYWHLATPRPYEMWLDYDNHFLPVCDAVYRFPGHSSGADKEVSLAAQLGIPVFFERAELDQLLA